MTVRLKRTGRKGRQKAIPAFQDAADGPVGLSHPDVIDTIALSPNRDLIQLVVHQDAQWDGSPRMRQMLDVKLNNYLRYIQSGQFRGEHPEARTAKWQIVWSIEAKFDKSTENRLMTFQTRTRQIGGDFKLHSPGEPWSWSFRT
jgi:hypothetical protein